MNNRSEYNKKRYLKNKDNILKKIRLKKKYFKESFKLLSSINDGNIKDYCNKIAYLISI